MPLLGRAPARATSGPGMAFSGLRKVQSFVKCLSWALPGGTSAGGSRESLMPVLGAGLGWNIVTASTAVTSQAQPGGALERLRLGITGCLLLEGTLKAVAGTPSIAQAAQGDSGPAPDAQGRAPPTPGSRPSSRRSWSCWVPSQGLCRCHCLSQLCKLPRSLPGTGVIALPCTSAAFQTPQLEFLSGFFSYSGSIKISA